MNRSHFSVKTYKILCGVVLFGLVLSALGTGNVPAARAQEVVTNTPTPEVTFPPDLEPTLSADGLTAYNAVPVLVLVDDPNPAMQGIKIPEVDKGGDFDAPGATFQFTYVAAGGIDNWGEPCMTFPESAKTAFNAAAAIWADEFQSAVPITIRACWASFSGDTLGYSGGQPIHLNFSGAPLANTWYQGSLANSLAGSDLAPSSFDMHITYNSNFTWYYGTDSNPPAGQHDLVTVAAHEIAHGLNFGGSASYSEGTGSYGYIGFPQVYDTFMKDESGNTLTSYTSPSTALGTLLTSSNLWFHGGQAMAGNGGMPVQMYAPSPWDDESSYSHLDYNTFAGTINSMMVFSLASGSANHNPGPITAGLLQDLGWHKAGDTTCLPPPSGLISWWPGNGMTQDIASGRDAELWNGASYGTGLAGQAFSLDGIDDFVSVDDNPALNFGTSDFTVDLWINFNTTEGEQILVEKNVESSNRTGWTLTKMSGNSIRLHLPSPGEIIESAQQSIPENTWIHFALLRSGDVFSIFMNGVEIASGTASVNVDSTSSLKFGHRGNPEDTPGSEDWRGFYLNGRIDEVSIYDRALTPTEITSIFHAGNAGKCDAGVPVARPDLYTTDEGVVLDVTAPGVLTNDTDSNLDPLTAVKVTDPAHGTLGLNSDGSFTYTPSTGFTGDDTFTYQASDGLLNSNVANVTITVTDAAEVVLIAPSGILDDWDNTFSWSGMADAEYYQLEVYDAADTLILGQWFTTSICSGLDCAVSPAEALNLSGGDFTWRIQTFGASGYGQWTEFMSFTINAVNPALISPTGTLDSWSNTFRWTGISSAEYYHLELRDAATDALVLDQWLPLTVCAGLNCAASPAETQNLVNGEYKWRLQGYGSQGYSALSEYVTFMLAAPILVLNAPTGTHASWEWDKTFHWTGIPSAEYYHTQVYDATNNTLLQEEWYNLNICSGLNCAVSPSETRHLGNGEYKWRVQTYGTMRYTPWCEYATFTISSPTIEPDAPSGTITSWDKTFHWTGIASAEYYHTQVYTAMDVLVQEEWYTLGICSGLNCAVSPSETRDLANGQYKWRVQSYGVEGYTSWTAYESFTINYPVVVLNAPVGTLTSWDKTFRWAGIPSAEYYHLQVYTAMDVLVQEEWYTLGICSGLSCAVSPLETRNLPAGFYKWRVQTYGTEGYTPWTAFQTFTLSQ
jgi:VCBS repeat-containing protein